MIAARKPQRDCNGFAVIRKYEPARIERELLARVFDVVTQGVNVHGGAADQVEAMMVGDGGSCVGVESGSVSSKLEQRERAA